jgi:hypothetical protein
VAGKSTRGVASDRTEPLNRVIGEREIASDDLVDEHAGTGAESLRFKADQTRGLPRNIPSATFCTAVNEGTEQGRASALAA